MNKLAFYAGFSKMTDSQVQFLWKKSAEKVVEQIPGGKAEGMTVEDIANKHKVPTEEIQTQVQKGMNVEKEHTPDPKKQKEIAKDHEEEFPNYYDGLSELEKKLKMQKAAGFIERTPESGYVSTSDKLFSRGVVPLSLASMGVTAGLGLNDALGVNPEEGAGRAILPLLGAILGGGGGLALSHPYLKAIAKQEKFRQDENKFWGGHDKKTADVKSDEDSEAIWSHLDDLGISSEQDWNKVLQDYKGRLQEYDSRIPWLIKNIGDQRMRSVLRQSDPYSLLGQEKTAEAKSKAQQRFFGLVRAVQKGEAKAPSKKVGEAAKDMSEKSVKDYAATKQKGLLEVKK